MIKKRNRNHW